VCTFIENITDALKGDLGLFNKYLQLIDIYDSKENYRAIELPGMPAVVLPIPRLVQE
jgi:hypothetical protein